MYQPYDKQTASTEDRIAWVLCQIIDDDAPLRWTRYRFAAHCIVKNPELMADLQALAGRSAPTPTCAPAWRKEDPVMLKFAGHKTMAEIKEQCEAQGVYLDLHAYHQGHDTICVGSPATRPGRCKGWAVYNVTNGRFWGCTPEGVEFNSDSAQHDGEPWMQALLHFFMVPK